MIEGGQEAVAALAAVEPLVRVVATDREVSRRARRLEEVAPGLAGPRFAFGRALPLGEAALANDLACSPTRRKMPLARLRADRHLLSIS